MLFPCHLTYKYIFILRTHIRAVYFSEAGEKHTYLVRFLNSIEIGWLLWRA